MKKKLMTLIKDSEPHQSELISLLEHYQNGRYEDAEKLALILTDKFQTHPFGWKVLGAILNQTGRISDGLIACQTSVILEPKNAEAHNNLGNTLHKLGKLEEAEKSHIKAIKLRPNFAESYNNLGNTLKELGKFEEALESYKKAIVFKKNYYEAYNNLGVIFKQLNRSEEAIAIFKKAIVLKPNYVLAHFNLGLTLKQLGQLVEAKEFYRKAIEIKPDYAEAYFNLGVTLKKLGELEEAEIFYRKAIKLDPNYSEAMLDLSSLLDYMNNLDGAIILLEKIMEIDVGKTRLKAAINLAIFKFLEDDIKMSNKFLKESSNIQEILDFESKNYLAYWKYLIKIIGMHGNLSQDNSNIRPIKTLYVIGESHSLVSHRLQIKASKDNFRCRALLIKGCKQWDLGESKKNQYKCKFEALFKSLHNSSKILLSIGEIDCRLDSGIIKHKNKYPEKDILNLISNTIGNYLSYIYKVNSSCKHNIIIQGVPCPNIDTTNISKENIEQLINLIREFNILLKRKSTEIGYGFLDVHKLTNRGDGFSNQRWHIDQYHLSPEGMREAWQSQLSS